jgi:hypothetical protein
MDVLGEGLQMNGSEVRKNRVLIHFIFFVLVSGATIMACNFTALQPNPSIVPEPTPKSTIIAGSISGTVWHDLCDSSSGEENPDPRCVFDDASDVFLANGLFENGEPGLSGVQVSLGKGMCPSQGFATTMSDDDGTYTFNDLGPGDYCISADLLNAYHQAKPVSGAWTYPKSDDGMGVGWITITLSEGEIKDDVNFGWDYLLQPFNPDPEPIFTPTPQPNCSNQATFVEDVTVYDGAHFSLGEEFNKVWRLKNVGTCAWNTEYSLVFVSGDQMSGLDAHHIKEEVPPGSELDLGVSLIAPEKDGSYKGYWMLQSDGGEAFGIGDSADKPFWVAITVGKVVSRDSVVSWTYELNPENLADEGRWVDVDLGQQLLTAYEGSTPIMRFVVSTGTAAHPTVTGQFRIWAKLVATDMSGPGYSLEDVPYTMYFYQGYGLHGTFWHNNFGTPMSHGCVNLRTPDAGWLFDFVSEGTLVNVHL